MIQQEDLFSKQSIQQVIRLIKDTINFNYLNRDKQVQNIATKAWQFFMESQSNTIELLLLVYQAYHPKKQIMEKSRQAHGFQQLTDYPPSLLRKSFKILRDHTVQQMELFIAKSQSLQAIKDIKQCNKPFLLFLIQQLKNGPLSQTNLKNYFRQLKQLQKKKLQNVNYEQKS